MQAGALGEGWSDAFATSINNDPVYGEYSNNDNVKGIRSVAYDNSTYTYASLCSVNASGCEVHSDGEIWATVLWDQRAALIAKYNFGPGKNRHERLMMDGIKATTVNPPDFLDARDGILSADNTVFGKADRCLLWRVFGNRAMGTTATTTGSADMSPTTSTATPPECNPVAKIGGPYTTAEGTDVALDASTSEAKGDAGDTLSYAWDFDADGQYDDATGPKPNFTNVGQDGAYPVGVQVTNTAGLTDTASATVTVTNVEPTVSATSDAPKAEGSLVSVTGSIVDSGWLEALTGSINWGDGTATESVSGALENNRPDATLSFTATHYYGDNGDYTAIVCGDDDDPPSTCRNLAVHIDNANPTLTLDAANLRAFREGDTASVRATFTDPGWLDTYAANVDYDNGAGPQVVVPTVTTQGGPGSPDVGEVTGTLIYGDNGTYTLLVSVSDDDGGTDTKSYPITVDNVNPSVTIDETGTTDVNGVKTFFTDVNQSLPFRARVTDPGSDDLTLSWNWGDGTGPHANPTSLVNPPNTDPAHSPSYQPRDITDMTPHAFGQACLYT
ncbi:MAG: M36 family metallopeptidase, partial [Actinobacteria bacterium]|nr:M36 family metallopeptidase [Actinomycetota bacterium]